MSTQTHIQTDGGLVRRSALSMPASRGLKKHFLAAGLAVLGSAGFASAAEVNLAWNANPETDIASYRLSYGTVSGQYTQVKEVGRNTRALVGNLDSGKTYYFVVTAVNYAGMESDPSVQLAYQTPPAIVGVNLAWNANPETDIAAYQLSYGTSSGQYSKVVDVGRNTRAQVSDLVQGNTYYFVVTAVNYAGMKSDPSVELVYQTSSTIASVQAQEFQLASISGVAETSSTSDVLGYFLGGDASGGVDPSLAPVATSVIADPDGDGVNGSYLLFSYRKEQTAAGDARIVASVEVSEDLAGSWSGLEGLPGVVVLEEPNAAAAGVDMVRVYLPMSLAKNGSLFARLAVSELAP